MELTFQWLGTDNEQVSYLGTKKSVMGKVKQNNGVGSDQGQVKCDQGRPLQGGDIRELSDGNDPIHKRHFQIDQCK